jgi:Transcription antiterminator
MASTQEFWFAARTWKDQEIATRNILKKMDIQHFLPTRNIVRQLKYRKKRVEVPVIRNLIFIRATKDIACSLPNDYGINVFYIQDCATRSMLVVPEKQMNDFKFVMDLNPEGACFDNVPLNLGDKVRVVKGEFCGIEGELINLDNRSHVVIQIPHVLSLRVRIPKSYLKRI